MVCVIGERTNLRRIVHFEAVNHVDLFVFFQRPFEIHSATSNTEVLHMLKTSPAPYLGSVDAGMADLVRNVSYTCLSLVKYLCQCLSVYLSVCVCRYVSVSSWLAGWLVQLFECLYICLRFCFFVFLCLLGSVSVYKNTCLYVCAVSYSLSQSVYLSGCLSVHASICTWLYFLCFSFWCLIRQKELAH